MLSIIIPTYNEEDYLPVLLGSIKKQTFNDYEIIVSDSESKDKTVEIAEKYGCKVINGPKAGVSAGRNLGAKHAKGDILLFLDADTKIGSKFIEENIQEFREKGLSAATVFAYPMEDSIIDRATVEVCNIALSMAQYIQPHAGGFCIFATKEVFDKVGGFDPEIKFYEDHAFVKHCGKYGKFRVLKGPVIYMSVRRFAQMGRAKALSKMFLVSLHRAVVGECKDDRLGWTPGDLNGQSVEPEDEML
ncbi:glycosyltransferase [Candidatus Woesearchaeota archaeon]|nr:glycosyltransferase [Candidatus Woesearchaeota archaeon]